MTSVHQEQGYGGAASLSRSAEKVEAAGFLLRSPIKPGSGRGSTSFLAQLFSHPRDNSLIHSIVSGVRTLLSIYQPLTPIAISILYESKK